jgi:hypothetical protein
VCKLSVVFYGWSCIINGGLRLLICSTFLCLIFFFYFYFFNFIWKLSYLKLCNPVSLNILCIWFAGMVLLMFGKCLLIYSTTSHWQHWLVCYYVILERTRVLFLLLIGVVIVCWLECHHFQLHVFFGLCNQNSEGFFLVVSVTPFWKKHTWYYYYFAL